jgi:hypothetical protein
MYVIQREATDDDTVATDDDTGTTTDDDGVDPHDAWVKEGIALGLLDPDYTLPGTRASAATSHTADTVVATEGVHTMYGNGDDLDLPAMSSSFLAAIHAAESQSHAIKVV